MSIEEKLTLLLGESDRKDLPVQLLCRYFLESINMILNCSSFNFFFQMFLVLELEHSLVGLLHIFHVLWKWQLVRRFPHEDLISQNVAWIESNE